jgi:hypothetical protein
MLLASFRNRSPFVAGLLHGVWQAEINHIFGGIVSGGASFQIKKSRRRHRLLSHGASGSWDGERKRALLRLMSRDRLPFESSNENAKFGSLALLHGFGDVAVGTRLASGSARSVVHVKHRKTMNTIEGFQKTRRRQAFCATESKRH